MKFNFEIKDKSLVTEEEYEQLEGLRLKEGYIWPAFNKRAGYVIIAKKEALIVGWGFVFKKVDNVYKTFYTYVRKDFRRNGIGSKIYKLALVFNDNEKLNVSRWSREAERFYDVFIDS